MKSCGEEKHLSELKVLLILFLIIQKKLLYKSVCMKIVQYKFRAYIFAGT